MLLAVERSSSAASAAVFAADGSACLAFVEASGAGAGDAWPLVRDALAAAGVSPADLDAFAVGVGPGSFSGIRSALALAQGLALPAGAPVRGVCSPAAALFRRRRENPDAPPARVVGDARRGHVWCVDEPADFLSLSHTAADVKLFSAGGADPALPDAAALFSDGRALLCADPARLAPLFAAHGAAAPEPAAPTARDVAALCFAGSSGPAAPVYLHPAVAGPVPSAV
ncbi:MAG: tRNA (adenosine(37)-N6)-threonylcarbamoyltransferase complex dimerization subunit type 1 TsaB [Kiritimatiellae bacterium]|nr:tRNA (adenosine(37)-N6)-threonylcarbamoyltransferase complex dimerization subunit type 1 TsaB [Kiritimatiellia bacterium]